MTCWAPDIEDHRDPYLLSVIARVKDAKDVDYVRGEIIKTINSYKTQLVAKDKLDAVKVEPAIQLRALARQLRSDRRQSRSIHRAAAHAGNHQQVYELYAAITPEDMQAMAKKYFVDEHRTIVTLSQQGEARECCAEVNAPCFRTHHCLIGLRADGRGRKGSSTHGNRVIAELIAARQLSFALQRRRGQRPERQRRRGGADRKSAVKRRQPRDDLRTDRQPMYPMATGFDSQVDKEMTVFNGTTHIDNLPKYYQIISEMLLNPGWRSEDFTRIREDAINYLKVSLRRQQR